GQSFTELSVERLASEAGVSRATFYVYFEDKGDLLRAWLDDIVSEVTEAARDWWALPPGATKAELRLVLDRIVRTYRPHTVLMSAVFGAATYDAGIQADVERFIRRNIAGLRRHIVDGQAAGSIDPGLRPRETAAWLTWMAERGLHLMVSAASDVELDGLIDAYTDIIWNTLYAPAGR
ncbi:MAG: TetR/AcrR family transcriptional regulator, partial [Sciscionella sp.]